MNFRPLDWAAPGEPFDVAALYYWFAHQVNGEDTSNLAEFVGPEGERLLVIEAEARLYAYKTAGCAVQLALVGGKVAGFLIYQQIFARLISIRCLHCEPWTKGLKLAKGLLQSLQPTPTVLIFQTSKARPPLRLRDVCGGRQRLLDEDEHFQTFSMEWRLDGTSELERETGGSTPA